MVICSPTPEWKRSSELDLNGEAVPDDDDDGGPAAPSHDNHDTDVVLGDEIPSDQLPDAEDEFSCKKDETLNFQGHIQFLLTVTFDERWKMLEKEVIEPRNYERHNSIRVKILTIDMTWNLSGLGERIFWLLSTVNKLLKEFIPKLSHDADGLIFQGWDDPYVRRTHDGLLKWMHPSLPLDLH